MALSIGELVGYVDLDTDAAEKAEGKLTGLLGGAKSKWGMLLGGAGVAAGAAFATSLVGAMNLEPGRDKVAAALDLTEAQAEVAGKVAGQVYADGWGESADEVNTALEAVISSISGMRSATEGELSAATEAALTFAQTMGVDVSRAAQVAGQLVRNGLAKDGVEAFDLLTAASSKVPAQLREDVLDAADEYGQFFAQLGMDGPTAMGLLAKGAEQGMYGIDKAGDALKEFTIRSTDMSATSKAAYDAIGLDAGKMANDILAGGDKAAKATDKIVGGLLGIKDPAKRANAAIALFGTPLEDLGTKNIPTFLQSLQDGGKALGDWQGATKKAGDTLQDNASENLERFSRKVKTAFVEGIGGKAIPVVNDLTSVLTVGLGPALSLVVDVLARVVDFMGRHTTTAAILAGVLGTLVAVTAAHEAVMTVSAAGGMAKWLASTKAISAVTKVWTAIQWAMNAALAANPIVLIVVLLAALALALYVAYKKSETFRDIVNGAFGAVSAVVSGAIDGISAAVGWVIDFIRNHWQLLVAILGGPLGVAVYLVVKHWDKIKSFTSNAIDAVVGFVTGIPGRFKSGLSTLQSTVRGAFDTAMTAGKTKVENIGETIVGWITGIPGKLSAKVGDFKQAGKDLIGAVVDGMKNAAGVISGIAGNVWDSVRGMLNGAIDKINAALEFTIDTPGPGGISINPPNIPHLATGGRADGATLAVIGEGREPETVLPDSVLRGLLERVHAAGMAMAGAGAGGPQVPLIGSVVQQPGESAESFAERLWFLTRSRG